MLLLVIGLAVLSVSFALLSFKKREIRRIMKGHVEVSAIVTSTKMQADGAGHQAIYPALTLGVYKYRINGNEYQGDFPGSLEVGSEVKILINASDNSISIPKNYIH